jgi:3-methylcrotonyl-CoA carboxylase alpha subunit
MLRARADSCCACATSRRGSATEPQDVPVWVEALDDRAHRWSVFTRQSTSIWRPVDPLVSAASASDHGGSIVAPMPAKVLSLLVEVGSIVRRGQALVVMEAMKMEHTLCAPQDGLVEAWLHAPGDQVAEGRPLLRLVDLPVDAPNAD